MKHQAKNQPAGHATSSSLRKGAEQRPCSPIQSQIQDGWPVVHTLGTRYVYLDRCSRSQRSQRHCKYLIRNHRIVGHVPIESRATRIWADNRLRNRDIKSQQVATIYHIVLRLRRGWRERPFPTIGDCDTRSKRKRRSNQPCAGQGHQSHSLHKISEVTRNPRVRPRGCPTAEQRSVQDCSSTHPPSPEARRAIPSLRSRRGRGSH